MTQPQPTPVPEPAGFDQWLDAMATELGITPPLVSQPTPPLDLDAIQARHQMYAAIHSTSGAYAQCAAQESAEDVPALIAENARLTADLADTQARLATALEELAALEELDLDQLYDNARPPEYCLSCLQSTCPGCTAPAPTV